MAPPRLHYHGLSQAVTDPEARRAVAALEAAIREHSARLTERWTTTVDLPVGAKVLYHALGRIPKGVTITPTVANATWAWAVTARDAKTVTITAVGVTQPGAYVEVF